MMARDKKPKDSLGITLGLLPIFEVIRITLMQTISQYALTQVAQNNAKGLVTFNGISLSLDVYVF